MFFTLFVVPMKAYITEELPWAPLPPIPMQTLPPNTYYHEDSERNVLLTMRVLAFDDPIPLEMCTELVLLCLPGAVFYGPFMIDLLYKFAASNHTRCLRRTLLAGVKVTSQCIWLNSGNDIDTTKMDLTQFTFTYAIAHTQPLYSIILFSYRLLYSIETLSNAKNLRPFSHSTNHSWSYSIMIGDPTSIILTNSAVSLAFAVDVLINIPGDIVAISRSSQNEDTFVQLGAFLYLSCGFEQ
ncbi:hypothetical protein THRCLA_04353 [Thraustotheca clavata]|uniref:Uncharacterized protein n=1 Tax=Thraustotheca clavata TaxID=74557 RepID=A0A1V9ZZH9_9STRA|nr:hypothetical protein THRCLA_04353 [Thraustotheca clavata]